MNCLAFFLTKRLSTSKVSSVSCEQIRVALFFFKIVFDFFLSQHVILNAALLRTHLLRRMIQDLITVCCITFFEHTLCIARCTVCVSYYARCVFLTMHGACFLLCSVSVSYYAQCVFLTMQRVCFLLCIFLRLIMSKHTLFNFLLNTKY